MVVADADAAVVVVRVDDDGESGPAVVGFRTLTEDLADATNSALRICRSVGVRMATCRLPTTPLASRLVKSLPVAR